MMSRFEEISFKYRVNHKIPSIIHKQFHTLMQQYYKCSLMVLEIKCDQLKKQYDDALKIYQEGNERFVDCPASSSDEIRDGLYATVKKLEQSCNRLHIQWIKSVQKYEDEWDRIEHKMPKCPQCEEIDTYEDLYEELDDLEYTGRHHNCDCRECEEFCDRYG
jgi:hypothetical protein